MQSANKIIIIITYVIYLQKKKKSNMHVNNKKFIFLKHESSHKTPQLHNRKQDFKVFYLCIPWYHGGISLFDRI